LSVEVGTAAAAGATFESAIDIVSGLSHNSV
jgi:hypothetical protein